MWRRTLFALIALATMTGAVGLTARAITPSSVISITWSMPDAEFGGWSGIDVTADGTGFVAVSDHGSMTRGTLQRRGGRLVGATSKTITPIKGDMDSWSSTFARDSEGVSLEADGRVAISYEGFTRVWRHKDPALLERIYQYPAFRDMQANGGLEAVATTADGTILTLPEVPKQADRYQVYANDAKGWREAYTFSHDGYWRAVGADVGPDGKFYLLERQFLKIGFISRIRRFDLSETEQPMEGEILYQSPLWRHGNLEGMGVWRDSEGHMRAVMVSDNNFLPFLGTEIVEVVLPR